MSFYTWMDGFATQVRRSLRLQNMGYYRGEDFDESQRQLRSHCLQEPVISYRETPYRPRRRHRQPPLQPEPTRMDRGTSPHVSIFQRDCGTSPHVSTFRRDQATSPHVSIFQRDFGTSPHVSTAKKDQATSPHISTMKRDQGTSPHVRNYMYLTHPVEPKRLEDKGTQTYWPEETMSTWSEMVLPMFTALLWIVGWMFIFYVLEQAGVHRSFDGDQKIFNEDKMILNGDKTILNKDKTILNGDKTILNKDKTILNGDKTILNGDKTILNGDKTILNGDQTRRKEDQKILNEGKILNEDKKTLNEEKKILNEDKTMLNEDQKILNEDRPILHSTITAWKFFVVGKKDSIYFNLPQPKVTTHLTLAHIAKVKVTNGAMATAPRDFAVYGTKGGKEHLLGRFTFDDRGAVHQTFTIPGQEAYGTLRLAMESNWGDTAFTCFHVWL